MKESALNEMQQEMKRKRVTEIFFVDELKDGARGKKTTAPGNKGSEET